MYHCIICLRSRLELAPEDWIFGKELCIRQRSGTELQLGVCGHCKHECEELELSGRMKRRNPSAPPIAQFQLTIDHWLSVYNYMAKFQQ